MLVVPKTFLSCLFFSRHFDQKNADTDGTTSINDGWITIGVPLRRLGTSGKGNPTLNQSTKTELTAFIHLCAAFPDAKTLRLAMRFSFVMHF